IAVHQQTHAPKLIRTVQGDLDWIVMKCLEKERTRRYESASGLADDIQRHLNNEPVLARPPSTVYRFQKLVRRNKGAFAAIGAGAVMLIVGSAVCFYLFLEERAAKQEQSRLREKAERTVALESQLRQTAELSQ